VTSWLVQEVELALVALARGNPLLGRYEHRLILDALFSSALSHDV
jgi:hypothetical protein